jgi:hypothetical protein
MGRGPSAKEGGVGLVTQPAIARHVLRIELWGAICSPKDSIRTRTCFLPQQRRGHQGKVRYVARVIRGSGREWHGRGRLALPPCHQVPNQRASTMEMIKPRWVERDECNVPSLCSTLLAFDEHVTKAGKSSRAVGGCSRYHPTEAFPPLRRPSANAWRKL